MSKQKVSFLKIAGLNLLANSLLVLAALVGILMSPTQGNDSVRYMLFAIIPLIIVYLVICSFETVLGYLITNIQDKPIVKFLKVAVFPGVTSYIATIVMLFLFGVITRNELLFFLGGFILVGAIILIPLVLGAKGLLWFLYRMVRKS